MSIDFMARQNNTSAKQAKVVMAAFEVVSAYGFKRTNMADIAKAAGMSRPALYLLFANKREIARAVVVMLKDASITNAKAALASDAPFQERLTNAMHARTTAFLEAVEGSQHGQELFETGMEVAGDILAGGEEEFTKLLQSNLRKAVKDGDINLKASDLSVPRLADLLIHGAYGQKTNAASAKILRRRINDFTGAVLAGLVA
ncbi:MAG: TetR family transcriptional regulator [Robiginitomaculum sp.]|nr:MAG: TetR family transcriptional regulator [Robiginitomaculum sp.]